jgi:PKD repeat protein
VDVRPPTPINVTVTASNSSPQVNAAVTFTATVTASGVTISRFEWDFGDGSSTVTTGSAASHVYRSAGRRTITVTAVSTEATRGTGQVEINVAAIALSVTVTGSANPTVSQPVTFTAAVTPTSVSVARYDWTFGDGTTASTNGNTVGHVYKSPGAKTVSVTAVTADGATGTGQTVINVAPVTLSVSASPSPAARNTVVNLTATVTPSGTPIQHYEWNFGDGSAILTTSAGSTTHIYTSARPYTIKVTAVLPDGTQITAQTELQVT